MSLIASICVNGKNVAYHGPDRMLLVDFLRHELRLTGTHVGCEMGVCGACTVIIDGEPARSCLTFAVQMDGCAVDTVESLDVNGSLSELQVLLSRHHGLQCGFCTPGVLMTFTALKAKGRLPRNEGAIRKLLSGNICRCTGYQGIVDALMEYAS